MEIKEIWYAGMIFILRQHTTLRLQYKKKTVSQEKKIHYDRWWNQRLHTEAMG